MIARGGRVIVLGLAGAAVAGAFVSLPIGAVCFGAALGATYFFRDPRREILRTDKALLSPVDGRVILTRDSAEAWSDLPPTYHQVGIFLSLADVHVVRSPADCEVLQVEHRPGRSLPARSPSAPLTNRQTLFHLRTDQGSVFLILTAGRVVRRCVSYVRTGHLVGQGERLALIRFGSRADLFWASEGHLLIDARSRAIGGQTRIVEFE
jgi:phosphatidylserine decarboxylase